MRLKDESPLRPPRGNRGRLLRGGDAYGLQSENALKQRGGEKGQWRWRNCHVLEVPKAVNTGWGVWHEENRDWRVRSGEGLEGFRCH